ncbi:hypothetical protein SISSUDRAFT_1124835 [Sistotremastrum suecicum HHB10207 ss-3]|uniref:Chromatin modification-related protein n=1 Tax=Sistotremastrum suecicum HHB10207 ss-3 TaxID=1314776 RepID=A0A166I1N8_9AGAM|nr:hypothetical protein SISSUDRAFT_1124835 [Sistotremastrum suecicum HHB10207 ss-3]
MSIASNPYALLLLSEYSQTLDSVPLDLSRHLADLRELDAVLLSSISSIIGKVDSLVEFIESGKGNENGKANGKARRAEMLAELAQEAERLKLGGEDKMRVASQAGDMLATNQGFLSALLTNASLTDPAFKPSALFSKTTFPHLPRRPHMDPLPNDHRRKRLNAGSRSILGAAPPILGAESPAKKRKKDEEEKGVSVKKPHTAGHASSKSKSIRPPSVESALSITMHYDHHNAHGNHSSQSHHHSRSHHTTHSSHATHSHSLLSSRRTQPTAGMLDNFLNSPPPIEDSSSSRGFVGDLHPLSQADRETADDGDPEKKYCVCGGQSWGEMIGCDDDNCKREWFHLSCVGLTTAPDPDDKWYCDECTKKRALSGRRNGKNSKSRNGHGSNGV